MIREEAMQRLIDVRKKHTLGMNETIAVEIAIKALSQEPCIDAVSREAVLDIVNNPLNIRLDEIIKNLPSVIPVYGGKDNG